MKKSAVEKRNPKLLKCMLTKTKFKIRNLKVNMFLNQIIFTIKQNIKRNKISININLLKKNFVLFIILCVVLEKQEISKELKDIADAMNDYYSHLSTIENVIKNWDPFKKANKSEYSKANILIFFLILFSSYLKTFIIINYIITINF